MAEELKKDSDMNPMDALTAKMELSGIMMAVQIKLIQMRKDPSSVGLGQLESLLDIAIAETKIFILSDKESTDRNIVEIGSKLVKLLNPKTS